MVIANKKYLAQVTVKNVKTLPAGEEVNNTAEAVDIEMPSRLYNDSYESANLKKSNRKLCSNWTWLRSSESEVGFLSPALRLRRQTELGPLLLNEINTFRFSIVTFMSLANAQDFSCLNLPVAILTII